MERVQGERGHVRDDDALGRLVAEFVHRDGVARRVERHRHRRRLNILEVRIVRDPGAEHCRERVGLVVVVRENNSRHRLTTAVDDLLGHHAREEVKRDGSGGECLLVQPPRDVLRPAAVVATDLDVAGHEQMIVRVKQKFLYPIRHR